MSADFISGRVPTARSGQVEPVHLQAKPKHKIVQATFMSCVDSVMQQEIFSFMQLGITGSIVHERLRLVSLTASAFMTSSPTLRNVPRIVSKIFT